MFEYFYNEILRRTIIGFGTLFNSMEIRQDDSVVRVPLAYGPTQKFLARIEQSPDLNKPMAITLPRMSFEFTGLTYDPSRKVTTTQTFTAKDKTDGTETKRSYMPVPYNMQFELSIFCKLNDDALQIVEQILPYFQPAYNLSIELVDQIKEKRDVPIVLEGITLQDDYEGDFTTRRVLYYTLRFTAKTYLFGPTKSASKDIIKRSTVSYSLEQIPPIQEERLLTLLLQEHLSLTQTMLLLHWQQILVQQQKPLRLQTLLESKLISTSSLEMRNYLLDPRLVIRLPLTEGEIIQKQRNMLQVQKLKELTIRRQHPHQHLVQSALIVL